MYICTYTLIHITLCFPFILPSFQRYQEVPATPLVSVQVLQDEKETWGDMQVGGAERNDPVLFKEDRTYVFSSQQ